MASPVNLAGTMPGEAVNGILAHVADLLKEPGVLRLVVGVIDVDTIKHKVATGDDVPVIQFRHLELVSADNKDAARAVLAAELSARTGQLELPLTPGAIAPPPQPRRTPADEDD